LASGAAKENILLSDTAQPKPATSAATCENAANTAAVPAKAANQTSAKKAENAPASSSLEKPQAKMCQGSKKAGSAKSAAKHKAITSKSDNEQVPSFTPEEVQQVGGS
jgi:hypothetical protein